MPRFFFHCEGAMTHHDAEGTELPDAASARVQAIETAGQLLKDYPHHLAGNAEWLLTVCNDVDAAIFVLRIKAETSA